MKTEPSAQPSVAILPPLPEALIKSVQCDSTMRYMTIHTYSGDDMREYATTAIASVEAELRAAVESNERAQQEIDRLKAAGRPLATMAFNLSQRTGRVIEARDAQTLSEGYRAWDTAITPSGASK
jgi:hypothetical protein